MKVINCSKNEHCIYYMQFQRYKKLYENLQNEYNEMLKNVARPDDEIEQALAERFNDEDFSDEL